MILAATDLFLVPAIAFAVACLAAFAICAFGPDHDTTFDEPAKPEPKRSRFDKRV